MRAVSYVTEVGIERPPEEVFDFCSDPRTEMTWNPTLDYVEKLTEVPVREVTRFEAK